jgi:glycosyltransferase involved in cell wall biosynthesis
MTMGAMPRVRVGFVISNFGTGWMGGLNYHSNLLASIAALPDRRIETVLLVGPDDAAEAARRFPTDELVATRLVLPRGHRRLMGMATQRVLGRNLALEWLARRHHIDVFTHMPPMGARSPLKVISWIPDFQHVRLPDFFSPEDRKIRDRGHRAIVDQANTIVLSSHDALNDLLARYQKAASRARVLQFVSGLGYGGAHCPRAVLAAKYGLDRPWFHVPNQLWKHKNHQVVIDALGLLRREGLAPLVVSTGSTEDFRHPGFLDEVNRHINAQGVSQDFRLLGLVPYSDVTALMHHAIAVINPSLFEGWSTTVEEAKSTGKRIILSDIPVHREQNPARATFFMPNDPTTLVVAIKQALADHDSASEEKEAIIAAGALPGRLRAFAETYQTIVLDTVCG